MLAPINCGGRCIFPQTVSDWQIGALSTAQYVNQPPSSQALHLLSLSSKSSRRPSSLLSPGPALSPSAGSLIYLHWRALPHYRGAHQPITIHFKWRAHQVGVTKKKCPRSLDLLIVLMHQVLRQTREGLSGSIMHQAQGDELIINNQRSGTVQPSLKSVLKVQGSVAQL